VICFSFGKGQTGGGQTLRHAGEPIKYLKLIKKPVNT